MAYTSGSSIDAEPSNDEIVRLTCLEGLLLPAPLMVFSVSVFFL